MTHEQHLAFGARHFRDLQTIRFAPVPLAMVLAPALRNLPHMSPAAAWALLLLFLSAIGGFYWWSTVAIRRRFGTVRDLKNQSQRGHPLIILLSVALVLYWIVPDEPWPWSDVYMIFVALVSMLVVILDRTNLTRRRIAWTIGLTVLFASGTFLVGVDEGAVLFAVAGAVWLALSIYDFLLFRRVVAHE